MKIPRREFLKLAGASMLSLYMTTKFGRVQLLHAEPIPGGTLTPNDVPKFATPLLIPPVMPRAGTFGQAGDYYEISMRQFSQQILPSGLPSTTVWGYGAVKSASAGGLLLHNAPSLTIEAVANRPVRIKWINELVDGNGDYLPHLLAVDPTLHWANPPGGIEGRDTRPKFTTTPGPYTGPVPIVTHVHGAAGVGDESDGYAEAWYLPAAGDIPTEFATEGTWYNFFAGKAATKFGVSWGPGYATYQYPNDKGASTDWYHDHTLGMTRLNVYAGPAGFFIIRGGEGDVVLDSRTGQAAVLPGPAPVASDPFPPDKTYYEIPLAIQDRSFNTNGSLFYPDTRAFFDGVEGPYIPETDIAPIWNPEFFGNMMMVNGNTWPFLNVKKRRYRFRVLNGCNSRFLILNFGNIPGVKVWQIGGEGGFLRETVNLTAGNSNRVLMAPAERADLIVDFTNVPLGDYVLGNIGPDEPFGGGVPGQDFEVADPQSTGRIMQFRVGPSQTADPTTPPEFLTLPAIAPLPVTGITRPLALLEHMSMDFDDAPAEALLGTVTNGIPKRHMWMEPVTENPALDAVETWEFYNTTADAHPIHIHEDHFQVVNRQRLATEDDEEEVILPLQLVGDPMDPEPWENGWKDTVIAYPGQVTRVRIKFEVTGQYVWHCHIVEHEDNEMMRPYRIGPVQPGQPGSFLSFFPFLAG